MLGDTLKSLRLSSGQTQDDMAQLLNIKRQTYSAYERNISLPDITSLIIIAANFNVDVGYLIKDEIKAVQGEQPLSHEQKKLLEEFSTLPTEDLKRVLEYIELLKLKQTRDGGGFEAVDDHSEKKRNE